MVESHALPSDYFDSVPGALSILDIPIQSAEDVNAVTRKKERGDRGRSTKSYQDKDEQSIQHRRDSDSSVNRDITLLKQVNRGKGKAKATEDETQTKLQL